MGVDLQIGSELADVLETHFLISFHSTAQESPSRSASPKARSNRTALMGGAPPLSHERKMRFEYLAQDKFHRESSRLHRQYTEHLKASATEGNVGTYSVPGAVLNTLRLTSSYKCSSIAFVVEMMKPWHCREFSLS